MRPPAFKPRLPRSPTNPFNAIFSNCFRHSRPDEQKYIVTNLLRVLSLIVLLSLVSCRPSPMPVNTTWHGTLELPEISIPFRMELDLSGAKATGAFVVGAEKTPIPEISRNENALTLSFSEYGAEMRGAWDGKQLKGDYLRHRAEGTKSCLLYTS